MRGTLQMDALAMASRLSTLRPLGSYRLQLDGGALGNPPRLRLQTLEGSLQMQGEGEWAGRGWRFRGEASAADGSEAALSNLLNILGRRAGARSVISLG
jgi:general secretion pathway protein N